MIEDWEIRRAFRYVYDKLDELDKRNVGVGAWGEQNCKLEHLKGEAR